MDGRKAAVELQARSRKWSSPIIGKRASHRQAMAADGLGLRVLAPLQCSLDRPDPAQLLFEFLFDMTIRLKHRLGRFPEVVELTQLVSYIRQHRSHGLTERLLPIGNDPVDRHG